MSIMEALAVVGLEPADVQAKLNTARSKPELQALLTQVKKQAKASWHRRAMELHPDRGGSVEAMQRLNLAWEHIKRLAVVVKAPPPRVVVFTTVWHNSASTNSWYGGTGSSW